MYVIKRDGRREQISLDKVTRRIRKMSLINPKLDVNDVDVAQKSVGGLYDGITTKEIDNFIAETAASMAYIDPDYGLLAGRIKADNIQKVTSGFENTLKSLNKLGMLNSDYYKKSINNISDILKIINYKRDYNYDIFSVSTLLKSYLIKKDNVPLERIQDMWMRTAITVTGTDFNFDKVKETYDFLSNGYYTHATPTLFNSGLKMQQLSSCFLLSLEEDSIDGIFNTLKDCARISKSAGGIGIHIHNLRGAGALIKGTNGESSGVVPFLKIFNETAKCVNQGGKRKGSFAIYLEPWHKDIEQFLELRKNTGSEEFRARDLFYALWMNDLFMERVDQNAEWTLMDESICPGLSDVYGENFKELYEKYEKEMPDLKRVKARDLMVKIIEAQIETGQPYITFKDAVNRKNNQSNLGTIKSSNLCNEIVEYSDSNETAVCNLASLNLAKFVKTDKNGKYYDFDSLRKVTKVAIRNLNNVIDVNYYPTDKAERSNERHRPVALGVQGLADVYMLFGYAYDSEEAKELNKLIFENIYYASILSSVNIAKDYGSYESYDNSPISKGLLQFDLWQQDGADINLTLDWDYVKREIKKYGVRNSLLTALMPTASTSNILGNTECFQIQTANIYKRQVMSGEFILTNKHLVKELKSLGLWDVDMVNKIILNDGSIQNIDGIPDSVKSVYKTVWEVSQKSVIDQCADRGPFIDQTQSMNLWLQSPTIAQVNSALTYGWKKGLKTGMYYLRSRSASNAIKTISDKNLVKDKEPENCEVCSA